MTTKGEEVDGAFEADETAIEEQDETKYTYQDTLHDVMHS